VDDDIETMIAQYLRDNFVCLRKDFSIYTLKQTLLMLTQSHVSSGNLPESALNFKCSTTHMRRFLKRNGLSFRRARPSRRPNLDEPEVTEFIFSFHIFREIFGQTALVSFDESSWRLVMTSKRTIAERGTEVANRYVNGDMRVAFTFFASVVADGTRLSLVLVAKGRTARCHKKFGEHE
jgi:hypothetical protein